MAEILAQTSPILKSAIINDLALNNQVTAPAPKSVSSSQHVLDTDHTKGGSVDDKPALSVNKPENKTPYIAIIDNICKPELYRNSTTILKEIKRCKPELKVTFAYQLVGGGIALHLPTKNDYQAVTNGWPTDAFQSPNINVHPPARNQSCSEAYIKSVPINITNTHIKQLITDQFQTEVSVYRLRNRYNLNPIQVVRIQGDSSIIGSIIESGIKTEHSVYQVNPKRVCKVVRCFNCQKYGHTANTCKNQPVCVRCSCLHSDINCVLPPKCANCGSQHPADSAQCNTYKTIRTKLINRHL